MRLQRRILLWFRTLFSSAHSPARRTVCTLRCCFRTPSKTGSRAALKRTPDPLAEAQHIYTSRKFLRPLCCFAPPLSILVYQEPLSGYRFYRAYFPEPGLVSLRFAVVSLTKGSTNITRGYQPPAFLPHPPAKLPDTLWRKPKPHL